MPYGRRQAPLGGGGLTGGFGGQSGGGMTQRPDPGLPKIAAETGGGYFELTRADDLKTTFARVADELHQQYALAFEPTKLDGKTHDLEVKLKTRGHEGAGAQELLRGQAPHVLTAVVVSRRRRQPGGPAWCRRAAFSRRGASTWTRPSAASCAGASA